MNAQEIEIVIRLAKERGLTEDAAIALRRDLEMVALGQGQQTNIVPCPYPVYPQPNPVWPWWLQTTYLTNTGDLSGASSADMNMDTLHYRA